MSYLDKERSWLIYISYIWLKNAFLLRLLLTFRPIRFSWRRFFFSISLLCKLQEYENDLLSQVSSAVSTGVYVLVTVFLFGSHSLKVTSKSHPTTNQEVYINWLYYWNYKSSLEWVTQKWICTPGSYQSNLMFFILSECRYLAFLLLLFLFDCMFFFQH